MKLKMEKEKTYLLTFNINGKFLVFTGTIVEDGDRIVFIDKFGEMQEFSRQYFVSASKK